VIIVSMEASQFWGAVVPDLDNILVRVPEVDRDLAAGRDWVETACDLVSALDLFAALGWARSFDIEWALEPDFEVDSGLPTAFWLLRDFDVLSVGDLAMERLLFHALGWMPASQGEGRLMRNNDFKVFWFSADSCDQACHAAIPA
jgi:hypothetical protein